MIRSYFIIALRSFRRGHIYSFINLFGLAIGLASVMLIIAYINYELSFDRRYSNSGRIYQLVMESRETEPFIKTVLTPEPLGKTLVQEFPEVESSTILHPYQSTYLLNNKPILLNAISVNTNFFDLFNLPFLKGNPGSALKNENNIVIIEEAAKRLFPDQEAIGQIINQRLFDNQTIYLTITGVIKNIPLNTHFNGDIIISQPTTTRTLNFESYSSYPQYITLKKHADLNKLQKKLAVVLSKYKLSKKTSIHFVPVTDIHLYSGEISASEMNISDIRYVYIFGSVAFLILLIGCINYVNLTTAQALQRIKEVGVRKTLGSGRRQLAFQFIGESFLFFGIAILLAVLLAMVSWSSFNNFLHIELPFSYLFNLPNILIFALIGFSSGLISGMYPAFFLSRMQPAGIFKDRQGGLRISFSLRKVLIVFQFSISMILIIATIVVWRQLYLFNNRPLGFNKEHLIQIMPTVLDGKQNAFKKSLLDNPNILAISFVAMELGKNIGNTASMTNPADSKSRLDFAFIKADFDFIETMGIKLKEGRNYSANIASDKLNYDSLYSASTSEKSDEIRYRKPIIITESLAKEMMLKNPVDTVMDLGVFQGTIIGVVKDFQVTTLKQLSPLLVYTYDTDPFVSGTYIRLNNQNIPESIRYIEKTWKQFFPDETFQYAFADESLQKMYESENRLASLFASFALLAIGISALGLFSLVALIVRQRNKEIGIRKVMGASVPGIVILLSKDFVQLILIAAVIASPIAWYGMDKWLQDFAHRIDIQWWIFALAGILALFIGMITVSFQAIKAAKMNPVNSLKNE